MNPTQLSPVELSMGVCEPAFWAAGHGDSSALPDISTQLSGFHLKCNI